MTQEYRDLLLKDLCARLPYGVKVLHTGWDCDSDTDFDTVETLIGIDDKFIYTIWDKTGDREKHCLSVSNWKPYLRPMSSMTEEEKEEMHNLISPEGTAIYMNEGIALPVNHYGEFVPYEYMSRVICFLLKHHFDFMGLIPKGLAIKVDESNNPYV